MIIYFDISNSAGAINVELKYVQHIFNYRIINIYNTESKIIVRIIQIFKYINSSILHDNIIVFFGETLFFFFEMFKYCDIIYFLYHFN